MRLDSIYIRKGKAWAEKYFAEMEKENSTIKHLRNDGYKYENLIEFMKPEIKSIEILD